jgi:hypothetical protein
MRTALVVSQYPYGQDRAQMQSGCNDLYQQAEAKIKTTKGVERIDTNVWLIDLDTGLSFLVWLVSSLESIGVRCQIAFLPEPPQWIQI